MRTSDCKGCGEPIVWMKTDAGKNIPVDPESIVDEGATVFDPDQMVSHFSTCAKADEFRKAKAKA